MSRKRHYHIRRAFFALLMLLGVCGFLPVESRAETLRQQAAEPEIGARAAIVVEYPSGRILYAKAMHDRLAPASTTKILTAILALEHGNLDAQAVVAPEDLVGESAMGLVSGESQSLRNLLYGMMLPSGNDAAMSVARYLGSQAAPPDASPQDHFVRFSDMMNARVAQLGLQNSHFVNPHGLDADGHYSSAYDLASLTWYAFQFPLFNEVVKQIFHEASGHPLRNTNEMLSRYAGADGVKTGWTDAGGLCLVASATRDGHRLISVTLDAPHWYSDSSALLDYGFARLSAAPQEDGAEMLSVAQRGTAAWLMADATATPPIPDSSAMAQGGGALALPASNDPSMQGAPNRQGAEKLAAHSPLGLNAAGRSGNNTNTIPSFLLGLAALGGGAALLWVLRARPIGFSPRSFAAPFSLDLGRSHIAEDADGRVGRIAAPRLRSTAHRTLGAPPVVRRREPNLLLTPDEVCVEHIERAVALAAEGRQGSSMAEFLLALRSGRRLRVAEVDNEFHLTPTACLALARAQASAGTPDLARETLEYAVAAAPGDRMLQLALRQSISPKSKVQGLIADDGRRTMDDGR